MAFVLASKLFFACSSCTAASLKLTVSWPPGLRGAKAICCTAWLNCASDLDRPSKDVSNPIIRASVDGALTGAVVLLKHLIDGARANSSKSTLRFADEFLSTKVLVQTRRAVCRSASATLPGSRALKL